MLQWPVAHTQHIKSTMLT